MWSTHCLSMVLLVLSLFQANSSVFYTDEQQQQSRPLPINRTAEDTLHARVDWEEHYKQEKMAQFQGQILNVLGLQKLEAKVELSNKLASRYMSFLYKQIGEVDEDNFNPNFEFLGEEISDEELNFDFQKIQEDIHSSDTIISFMPTNIIKIQEPALVTHSYELLFELANNFDGLDLLSAQINFIFRTKTDTQVLLKGYSGSFSSPVHIHGFSTANDSALMSLNVTQIFKEWLKHPRNVQQLFVELTVENGAANSSLNSSQIHCFGVGFFVESEHQRLNRVKRSMSQHMVLEENWHEEGSEASSHASHPTFFIHNGSTEKTDLLNPARSLAEKRCRLQSLYVDFKDLGWDGWVIAPTGYQADYCDGHCSFPLDSSVTPTNHAIVQTLAHVLNKQRALPARCAPTSMKSQSILYFNNQQNVVMRRYQNMRVKQCGCR